MKRYFSVFTGIIIMVLVTACPPPEDSGSSTKEITSFSFSAAANNALDSDVTGVIAGTDVSLTVPYGTNVTALVATFTTNGSSVTVDGAVQTSGTTVNDFTNPLTYKVTAENSSTQDYVVTVNIASNTAKEITSFNFTVAANAGLSSDVTGTINGTAIMLTVPYGTNITALVATFATTGNTVTMRGVIQASGTTANDFSNPVTYRVAAANGTTKDYTVIVSVSPADTGKEIISFSFSAVLNSALDIDVMGVINGTEITLTLPYETDRASLVATFITTGKTVTVGSTVQESGSTINDFSNPLTYQVTAEDSIMQLYTVCVNDMCILHASDLKEMDFFGGSVSIFGEYAVIGANIEDGGIGNPYPECGAAYVYKNDGFDNWEEIDILHASDLHGNDLFGTSVSVFGDYIIVGAMDEDGGSGDPASSAGAAYIFKNDGLDNWEEIDILHASDLQLGDRFGRFVSIYGNYAIVGAYLEDGGSGDSASDAGAAYIFKNDGFDNWEEIDILHASDLQANDQFGYSVSISGEYAIVGAAYEDGGSGDPESGAGAAYIFKNDGIDNWEEIDILHTSDMQASDCFGWYLSISGDYIIVGAAYEDGGSGDPAFSAGAAYIFKNDGFDNWEEIDILHASDLQANDNFGCSVGVNGDYVVVGAYSEDGGSGDIYGNAGASYIIRFKTN